MLRRHVDFDAIGVDRGYRHVTVRLIEMPSRITNRVLGAASTMNRDVRFLGGVQRSGRAQPDRLLARPPPNWACSTGTLTRGDHRGRRAPCDGAVPPPIGCSAARSSEYRSRRWGADRPMRKQVAGDRAPWTLRLTEGAGLAEADFTDGRVSELRLGPVR
ncbi:hypothetical protein [Pseudonocardia xishanensis]|uniref:Uncharacterized protein n=1 Tax=Pseudonocardia xishanensis TaxID=630995 RepID=A0ABP8S5W6_9PSEU